MVDPLWAKDTLLIKCEATTDDLMWEATSDWWWCKLCGHCSNMYHITHYIAEVPKTYYDLSLAQFLTRRGTQGLPERCAEEQACHVAGVALRVAASKRPEEFAKLVDSILALVD